MIQFDSIELSPDGQWHFDWDSSGSDTDQFDLYLYGYLLANVTGTSYDYATVLSSDDPPPIEVVPTGESSENILNSPIVTFQWYGDVSVRTYLVEQEIDSQWAPAGQFPGGENNFILSFESRPNPDQTTVTFRITAMDQWNQPSAPRTVTRNIVCNPEFGYNADNISIDYIAGNVVVDFEEE